MLEMQNVHNEYVQLKTLGFIYNVAIQKLIEKGLIDENEIQEKVRAITEGMSDKPDEARTDENNSGNEQP